MVGGAALLVTSIGEYLPRQLLLQQPHPAAVAIGVTEADPPDDQRRGVAQHVVPADVVFHPAAKGAELPPEA